MPGVPNPLEPRLKELELEISELKEALTDIAHGEPHFHDGSPMSVEQCARLALNRAYKKGGYEEMVAREIDAGKQIICDCGTPGCNRVYDHRRGSGGNFAT